MYCIKLPDIWCLLEKLLGRKTARQLGDTTVGELDTASIATAYRIWHTWLLPLLLFKIMAQHTILRSVLKKSGESDLQKSLIERD